jgi:hypothetical protein
MFHEPAPRNVSSLNICLRQKLLFNRYRNKKHHIVHLTRNDELKKQVHISITYSNTNIQIDRPRMATPHYLRHTEVMSSQLARDPDYRFETTFLNILGQIKKKLNYRVG